MAWKRMGRPIDGHEPRDRRITIRATRMLEEELVECAQITGKTKTEIVELAIDRFYDELTENKK